MDGVGVVQIEFQWHTDPDDKYDEVVREVNRIRSLLPADLASLEVRKASSGLVNIVQIRTRQRGRGLPRAQGPGRAAARLDRDGARRAPQRGLGLSGAGGARRRGPRAHGPGRRHARPDRARDPRRERLDPRRRRGRRPAQVQPAAPRAATTRSTRSPRPWWRAASGRIVKLRDVATEVAWDDSEEQLHRSIQRRACGLRHGEREGSRRRVRGAQRRSTSGSTASRPQLPGRRAARARLRPDAQRQAAVSTASGSTSRSRSASCC